MALIGPEVSISFMMGRYVCSRDGWNIRYHCLPCSSYYLPLPPGAGGTRCAHVMSAAQGKLTRQLSLETLSLPYVFYACFSVTYYLVKGRRSAAALSLSTWFPNFFRPKMDVIIQSFVSLPQLSGFDEKSSLTPPPITRFEENSSGYSKEHAE